MGASRVVWQGQEEWASSRLKGQLLCGCLQTEYARLENGRFVYRIHRSPMCEYMINFIHKLKHLPEKYMMNSVLENFTILQVRQAGSGPGGGFPGETRLEYGPATVP